MNPLHSAGQAPHPHSQGLKGVFAKYILPIRSGNVKKLDLLWLKFSTLLLAAIILGLAKERPFGQRITLPDRLKVITYPNSFVW